MCANYCIYIGVYCIDSGFIIDTPVNLIKVAATIAKLIRD